MSIADKYKGFIIDLDGVMYLDGKLLAHSKSFILKLIKLDCIQFIFNMQQMAARQKENF